MEPAVLLKLACAGGVDDAVYGLDEDVWGRGVDGRVAKSGGDQLLAPEQVLDLEFRRVRLQVRSGLGGVFAVREPHERDVVGRDLRDGDTGGVVDGRVVDLVELGRVDGRLAVLGRHDDEGVVVDALCLQGRDNLTERSVDEVDRLQQWCGEGKARGVEIACCLFSNTDGLEVAAEQVGRLAVDRAFRVRGVNAVDPVEEGGNV